MILKTRVYVIIDIDHEIKPPLWIWIVRLYQIFASHHIIIPRQPISLTALFLANFIKHKILSIRESVIQANSTFSIFIETEIILAITKYPLMMCLILVTSDDYVDTIIFKRVVQTVLRYCIINLISCAFL